MTDELQIPGYRVEAQLGRGGMATVYRAIQESLDRPVALKVMAPALAADADFTERFLKEGRTAAQLTHPHILAVHDIGVSGHHHYIAMEYVGGGDLKARIRAGLEPDAALQVVRQIASALGFAHERGFVHRDVKPENILFREDGTAVLADFGIARAVGSGTRMTGTGMSIGTPHYMSPEQARGQEVDARSDLYSVGVVLYEALTGQVPYDAEDSFAVGIQHISAEVPELPAHLHTYQPLLDRLLAKDPAERPASAQALIQTIDRVRAGETLARTTRAPAAARPDRAAAQSKGRDVGLKWGIGGGLLALLVLGGVYVWQQRPGLIERPFAGGGGASGVSSSGSGSNAGAGDVAAPSSAKDDEPQGESAPDDSAPSKTTTVTGNESAPTTTTATEDETKDASSASALVGTGEAILEVRSEPSGARVWLDGRELGTTPYFEDTIRAGERRLKVSHKNHEPYTEQVRLEAAVVTKREVSLDRGEGTLTVLTEPSGARVAIDGEVRQGETPLTVRGLEAGEHALTVRKARYRTHEQTLVVPMDETRKINLKLEGGDLVEYRGEWIARDEKIERLLATAEEHLQADRLTRPKGNNARSAYRAVLDLDEDNERARAGLQRIGERYVELARSAMASESFDKARVYLNRAAALQPGSENLANAQASLAQASERSADKLNMSVPSGAVAVYPFDGDANDASGRGHTGTIFGAIPARGYNGQKNTAYSFDGDDDYIRIDDTQALRLKGKSFTIAAWIKVHSSRGKNPIISKGNDNNFDLQYLFMLKEENEVIFNVQSGTWHPSRWSHDYDFKKWHHIAVVYDVENELLELYVDGQSQGKREFDSAVFPSTNSPVKIAHYNGGNNNLFFDGVIDNLVVYDRALGEEEIGRLLRSDLKTLSKAISGRKFLFRITSKRYTEKSDYWKACREEFGKRYEIADWVDLEAYYEREGEMTQFFEKVEMAHNEKAWIARNGKVRWRGNRYYFVRRFDQEKTGNFLAHADINSHTISLGSWQGNMPVLCYNRDRE